MSAEPQLLDVVMPRLSDSMEEGVVSQWLKQAGERVEKGAPLVEVETDKATVVYEADFDGVLHEIVVAAGESAALGAVIARAAVVVSEAGGVAPAANDSETPPAVVPDAVVPDAVVPDAVVPEGGTPEVAAPVQGATSPAGPLVRGVVEFREALRQALDEELDRDPSVIFFGEDVALAGGVFAVTPGLYEKYGAARVFDTPISELAMTGAAFGAAVTGKRPVLEIMFGDFLALAMDSLINQATKHWFLTGGRQGVPLVIRSVVGAGGRFGAIHSQMPISWLMGIPGLKIVAPSTPGDAKGLLKAAIRDNNPVIFFEHKRLYSTKGPLGESELIPLGSAAVVRAGSDVTIVSAMKGVHDALEAAELLAADGLSAEVIDLRTLRPLDLDTVARSLEKTNRIVVVEEGPRTGGWAGEVLALAIEHCLGHIEDAWRITTADSPIPYSPPLEDAFLPGPTRIAAEVRARLQGA
jgi:pyruvate/2-oxoglutarate/acetoin dehydrogenase E1 component